VQSAATAAGSLGLLFTSGFPAAYQLGLLGASPKDDIGKLFTFTICCAYYGMFFAIPLRKFYILKQKLLFPSAVAAAYTIRSLHVGKNAEANARKKTKALIFSFCGAITLRVVSEYAPGMLWDWHWGWTFYRIGWTWIIKAESWNWVWEWTPAFIGVGMLTGLNASYSFLSGSFLAWAIIGPALVTTGKAFGEAVDPNFPGLMNYNGMVMDDPINAPTPRYWLVWYEYSKKRVEKNLLTSLIRPGTMLLLCGSFAELGANYRTIWASVVQMLSPVFTTFRKVEIDEKDLIYDPAPDNEQVPWWVWTGGIVISAILTCVVLGIQYGQSVGVSILSIVFAFVFSFIGAESTGRTNITPVTSIGNASQLVVGGITRGHYPIKDAQMLNLAGGMLALGASEQSADMLGDLKTTHLLRASPRVQFYAQMVGALVSIFMSVGMYILFSAAYPCINNLSDQAHCAFPAPDVGAWRAIAVAVTSPSLPIPPSSGFTSIGFGILAVVVTFIKYRFIPVSKHDWVPNLNAIGIAFILPTSTYPTAMAFGATVCYFWQKNYPMAYSMYCYAIAAVFIAGEGLGGIVGAVLQVAKVSGNLFGTAAGCPAFIYCG
jgi:OPT family oligopeptide transporter